MKTIKLTTTKQYVTTFFLNPEGKKKQDLKGFYETFCQEFKQRVELTLAGCQKIDAEFTYSKFQNLVREMDTKFSAISNKSVPALEDKLWNKFFAAAVLPERALYFPEEHAKISAKRDKYLRLEQELADKADAQAQAIG